MIKIIDNKEVASRWYVINIIKESDFVFETSTECTNFAIVTGVFPEALKKTNITSVH